MGLTEEHIIKWDETADTESGLYSVEAVQFLAAVKFLCPVTSAAVV